MRSARLSLTHSTRRVLVASASASNRRIAAPMPRVGTGRTLVVSGFVLLATALVAYLVSTVAARGGAEWLLAPAALLGALAVRAGEKACAVFSR